MEKLVPKLRFPEFKNPLQRSHLGGIAKFLKGKGISKSDIDNNGINECIRYGELYTTYGELITKVFSKTNISKSFSVLSEINDIIIPSSGESQLDIAKASCVLVPGVILGGDLNIIRLGANGVFFSYYLNSAKKNEIAKIAQGNSVVHLYSSQLSNLIVNYPSLPEQQKIASFLSTVEEKINLLKKQLSLLEQYKKGVMQKIFSREIRFKDEDGNEFPEWEEKKLGEVGEIITGKTPSTNDNSLWGGDIQFVTPTDISKDKFQYKASRYVVNHNKMKILPKNTIMFTCIASIGKMSLSIFPCITNQQINSIIPNDNFENEFVFYALLQISDFIKSTRSNTTLPIINKSDFSNFIICAPSLPEQQKILSFLSSIDEKIDKNEDQIRKTELWKKGLLQQMFI